MLYHVVQVIAGLKSNIEALEGESYELQQVRDQLDMRRSQLETHNQQLAIKTEHLTGIVVVAAMSDFAKYTTDLPPARKIPPCRGAAPIHRDLRNSGVGRGLGPQLFMFG